MRYADAGVDISRAEQAKERIRRMATRTFTRGVVGGIGAFGGLFALDVKRWREPVLVSSTDGVGTKLKIAAAMGIHSTVGGDLVNHCVNDILTQGAEPLFFSIIWPWAAWIPTSWNNWSTASPAPAIKPTARWWGAKRPNCRTRTLPANTIWPGSSSASSNAAGS